jgi:phage gp36-like protein
MSYITKDDILKSISEEDLIALTDDDNSGVVDDEVVNDAISNAESLVNSYLRRRIKELPLTSPPKIIKAYCVDIAIYFLESRDGSNTEARKENYTNAVNFLKDFSKGLVEIENISESDGYQEASGIETKTSDRLFTDEILEKF